MRYFGIDSNMVFFLFCKFNIVNLKLFCKYGDLKTKQKRKILFYMVQILLYCHDLAYCRVIYLCLFGDFNRFMVNIRRLRQSFFCTTFRMTLSLYDQLLAKTSRRIEKQTTHLRNAISASERLAVTLRYCNFPLVIKKQEPQSHLNIFWNNNNNVPIFLCTFTTTFVYKFSSNLLMQWRCWGWWYQGRNFVVSPLFGPKIGEDQKKRVIVVKVVDFWPRNMRIPKQKEKKRFSPLNWLVFSSNEDGKKIFTTNQWRYGFTS